MDSLLDLPARALPSLRAEAVAAVLAGRPLPDGDPQLAAAVAETLETSGLGGLAVADARARGDGGSGGALARAVVDLLTPAYHRTALHTTLLVESTERALAALEADGIRALVFKGVALLRSGAYADPGARPLEDGDVLIEPERAADAVRALVAAGFEPWEPWTADRMTWLSSHTLTDASLPAGIEGAIDLHWATPYARLRLAGPWPRDPLWEGAGGALPAPEAHFALLAEHVLKHLRVAAHLRGVTDLVRLAPSLSDGVGLVRQARRRGSLPGLRRLVGFLGREVGVELPAGVVDALDVPDRPSRAVARRLSIPALLRAGDEGRGAGLLSQWLVMGSGWRAAAEVVRVALPSRAWLAARYPRGGGRLGRRARYVGDLSRWLAGRGPSPLSPNQGLQG